MTEYHPKNVDIDHGGEKGHHEFTNHSLPTLSIIQSFEGLSKQSVCMCVLCLQGSEWMAVVIRKNINQPRTNDHWSTSRYSRLASLHVSLLPLLGHVV